MEDKLVKKDGIADDIRDMVIAFKNEYPHEANMIVYAGIVIFGALGFYKEWSALAN